LSIVRTAWALAAALGAAGAAWAFDESADGERALSPREDEKVAWKLTTTYYSTTNEPGAGDINLRGVYGPHTAWVGYYEQPGEFRQARVGYEYTVHLPACRWCWGRSTRRRGFSVAPWRRRWAGDVYGLIGVSRTNEKPYFNLNFDPNDAWTFGVGARLAHDTSFLAYQVRGEWVAAGQQVTHAVYRTRPTPETRVGIDLFYKYGPLEGEDGVTVRAAGASVALDYRAWFARITWDPKVNFTPNDMLRVAVGLRF